MIINLQWKALLPLMSRRQVMGQFDSLIVLQTDIIVRPSRIERQNSNLPKPSIHLQSLFALADDLFLSTVLLMLLKHSS